MASPTYGERRPVEYRRSVGKSSAELAHRVQGQGVKDSNTTAEGRNGALDKTFVVWRKCETVCANCHHAYDLGRDGFVIYAECGPGGRYSDVQHTPMPHVQYEISEDLNEPTYCYCNKVSFGEMVACDNTSCPHEWFHYGCVGLSAPPDGGWLCPTCIGEQGSAAAEGKD